MTWLPGASDGTYNVATPEPLRVPAPSTVAPSLNVTVPVGVPVPGGLTVTVAVNVIGWYHHAGLSDDDRLVVVAA